MNKRTVYVMKNMTKTSQRVPTTNGKQEIGIGEEFECHKKDGEALLRMYSGMFEKVDSAIADAKEVGKKIIKEVKEDVKEEESKLEVAKRIYEEKLEKKVPVNKKNDLEWIINKIKDL
jgi:hypothetical protein